MSRRGDNAGVARGQLFREIALPGGGCETPDSDRNRRQVRGLYRPAAGSAKGPTANPARIARDAPAFAISCLPRLISVELSEHGIHPRVLRGCCRLETRDAQLEQHLVRRGVLMNLEQSGEHRVAGRLI